MFFSIYRLIVVGFGIADRLDLVTPMTLVTAPKVPAARDVGAILISNELLSKVVDGASGGDLILPDSVDEFHIFNDLSQAAVAW